MALIRETKKCIICSTIYSPKKGVSRKQWEKSRFCSSNCFGANNKNKKLSEETRQKISISNIGRIVSEETRKKISIKNYGKIRGESWIKNLSRSHLGQKAWNKGKKYLSISGEKHWNWKIDRNSLAVNEKKHLDSKYKHWMKQVKGRDSWKCKINNQECSGRIEAHHILPWSDYPELRYNINNGISLCHFHHPRKKNDEKKLAPFFNELVRQQL